MREAHPQVLTESMATLERQLPKSVSDGEAGALVRTGWAFKGCHLGSGSQGTPEEGSR